MAVSLRNILGVARMEWRQLHRESNLKFIYFPLLVSIALAVYIGWQNTKQWNKVQEHYQKIVEEQWKNQPSRHPHRASHYGYMVFRDKFPLSAFDFGVNSFVGNAVFLEAHRQNTVNMSEASFSNGILRFGELSMAWCFQIIVPLFIIFMGFACVSGLKANGMLRLILIQGCNYRELLLGKILGLYNLTMAYFMPFFLLGLTLICGFSQSELGQDLVWRAILLTLNYSVYLLIFVAIVVGFSALHKSPKTTLLSLLILWFVLIFVLPKTAQSIGEYYAPSPNKNDFEAQIHKRIQKQGDSHDPKDAHYRKLRENLLAKYKVKRLEDLPVNYAGIQLYEGEKISSQIFREEFDKLIASYRRQNQVGVFLGFLNPYLAIRNSSMLWSGSSFADAVEFQRQVEKYRYERTQKLNILQAEKTKFFSNFQLERLQKIDQKVLASMPTFHYHPLEIGALWQKERATILALWVLLGIVFGAIYCIGLAPNNYLS